MRVATWNVNSMKARHAYVLDWLGTRRPDVACLQELKVAAADFPRDDIEALGYDVAVHAQPTWNGVAVLATKPTELVQGGLPGVEDQGARLVTAHVDDLSVTSVYVPNGKSVANPDFAAKLEWLDALIAYAQSLLDGDRGVIIGGDFNLCPADIDSYHPDKAAGSIFHTGEERRRYEQLIELGLVDVFRNAAPNEAGFSWWDYRQGQFHKGNGLRIDLLLATPDVAERVTSVAVDRTFRKKREGIWDIKPSDHAPVEAVLGG